LKQHRQGYVGTRAKTIQMRTISEIKSFLTGLSFPLFFGGKYVTAVFEQQIVCQIIFKNSVAEPEPIGAGAL
jgi:hypothetical protein